MSFIRTVLGDIAPEELGVCYAHEHLIIDPSYATEQNPDFLLDSVEKGVAELKELKALGVGACVDSMPSGCGANFEKLKEISRQTGVHIIAPTGVHLAKYHAPDMNSVLEDSNSDPLRVWFEGDLMLDTTHPVACGLIKVAALKEWCAT